MADTVYVDVPTGTWTEILAAASTALISNEGAVTIRIVEGAGAPANSVIKGHTLNIGEKITRTTPAGQEIYARAFGALDSFVAVTTS
jgi:hypothetical protein